MQDAPRPKVPHPAPESHLQPQHPQPRPLTIHSALLLVSVLFGINFVAIKEILATVPPRAWAFYRLFFASCCLLPLVWSQRLSWPRGHIWWGLTLAAFLGMFANQALFTEGLARTSPKNSAVITNTIPVLVLCFAVLTRMERLRLEKVLAVCLGLCGVAVLLELDQWSARGTATIDEGWIGDLLVFLNVTVFSMFVVLMRHLGRSVPPLMATTTCFLLASAMMAVFAWGQLDLASLALLAEPRVLALAAFAVLGGTVLTYLINNWALQHADPSKVTLYIFVQPVIAVGLSAWLQYEPPGPRFYLAATLIFSGLLLTSLAQARRQRRLRLAMGQPD